MSTTLKFWELKNNNTNIYVRFYVGFLKIYLRRLPRLSSKSYLRIINYLKGCGLAVLLITAILKLVYIFNFNILYFNLLIKIYFSKNIYLFEE